MASDADLQLLIPELNPLHQDVINLGAGDTHAVITDRVRRLIGHRALTRLGGIRQLGLITLVYPGATHSRLEHCLGTYAKVCDYIRALYYNRNDPMFRSIFEAKDYLAILLASLLHDVGYYPLAHDLEDCSTWKKSGIRHEEYTKNIINGQLASVIGSDWNIDSESVVDLIVPKTQSFRSRILRSIINGPIDADKLDYLLRDGMHLGLPYSNGIDKQWFLRSLTVVYGNHTPPGIAVTDKGRVSAESIAFARYAMFSVAYWHHTVRAIKAMIRYAVGRVQGSYKPEEHFAFFNSLNSNASHLKEAAGVISSADMQQLLWISDRIDEVGKAILDDVISRRLYKRIFVIDSSSPDTEEFHKRFRTADADFVERFRVSLETEIRKRFTNAVRNVQRDQPTVLVDIPKMDPLPALYYRTEQGENLLSASSVVWRDLGEGFSQSIGKVRIFAHPDCAKALHKNLPRHDFLDLIDSSMESGSIRG